MITSIFELDGLLIDCLYISNPPDGINPFSDCSPETWQEAILQFNIQVSDEEN